MIEVFDGDTVVVQPPPRGWTDRTNSTVRLFGIDAPEWKQPLGKKATERLLALVIERRAGPFYLECVTYDSFGREVGLLYPKSQGRYKSLNVEMVRLGYAYCWGRSEDHGTMESLGFLFAQAEARRNRRGIWKASPQGDERPWMYRKRRGSDNTKPVTHLPGSGS